jgi:S1-C subfamily serine protease
MPTDDDLPVLPADDDDRPPRRPRPAVRRPEPAPDAPAGSFRPLIYLLLLVFGVGLGVAGFWAGSKVLDRIRQRNGPGTDPNAQLRAADPNGPLDVDEQEANHLFEVDKESVVNVDTVMLVRGEELDEDAPERQAGTGSGFIWDADGRVVTNYHVVEWAIKKPERLGIRVRMADESRPYEARVVGVAPDYDLAVIQIVGAPKEKFKPLGVARSNDLQIGQKVYAIGNPFGLSHTLTQGIISALDRTITAPNKSPIPGAIQHSAPINPGNSGGPLLNRAGKLIGVNTSIPETKGGGNVGIGFAIPSDTVNEVVTEMIRNGRPVSPDLGLTLYDMAAVRRARYERGVVIDKVAPGGPADAAGLRGVRRNTVTGRDEPRDLILAINGTAVNTPEEYQRALAKLKPGQPATVKILRIERKQEQELDVTVTPRAM